MSATVEYSSLRLDSEVRAVSGGADCLGEDTFSRSRPQFDRASLTRS